MSGLTNKERRLLLKDLAISERLQKNAEKVSPERQGYSEILRSITKDFKEALKNKDYVKLFDLEKVAQEHDAAYHAVDKEKTLQIFAAMDTFKQQFLDGMKPDKVREKFLPSIERLKMQDVRMKDKAFDLTANSIKGFINSFKSPRCVPAENGFYSIRSDAIKALQQEHQRNIDVALGYDSKDRGISR